MTEEKTPRKEPNSPLTRQEIHHSTNERVHLIAKEFTDGFNFLGHYPKSVTIFGGVRVNENDEYYIMARSLGRRIVKDLNYAVFTGGGPGIMEAANRGAFEAGGESLGLTIELPTEQDNNKYLTKRLDFYYFFSRKTCLYFSAEAYIIFPGGYGTLDEFFELVTLIQTGKIERVPLILVGSEFWKPWDKIIKDQLLGQKMIDENDVDLYKIIDNEDEILDIIRKVPVKNGIKFTHTNN